MRGLIVRIDPDGKFGFINLRTAESSSSTWLA